MAVLESLKNLGKGITFNNKATLKDGTQVLSPKATVVRSGDHITKADGTNLAPGTYQSDKYITTYNPLGTFTVGNNGLVGQVNIPLEVAKVVEPVAALEPVVEAKEDLTIKPIEVAKEPEKPAETDAKPEEEKEPDTEVKPEDKPVDDEVKPEAAV
jgi:hypothetical protein